MVSEQVKRRQYLARLRYQKKVNSNTENLGVASCSGGESLLNRAFSDAPVFQVVLPDIDNNINNFNLPKNAKRINANPGRREKKRKTSEVLCNSPKRIVLSEIEHQLEQPLQNFNSCSQTYDGTFTEAQQVFTSGDHIHSDYPSLTSISCAGREGPADTNIHPLGNLSQNNRG